MARAIQAVDLIQQVLVETGLAKDPAPFQSLNQNVIQMIELLNSCGEELAGAYAWNSLVRRATIHVEAPPGNPFALPADFASMVDQTQWNRSTHLPAMSVSGQVWAYLEGRGLASSTIYAVFRIDQNQVIIFPTPPPAPGFDLSFEYLSDAWVKDVGGTFKHRVTAADDTVLYQPILIKKMLKAKFLSAKGLDSTLAQEEYSSEFDKWTSKDAPANVLTLDGPSFAGDRPIDSYNNLPDTGFGS